MGTLLSVIKYILWGLATRRPLDRALLTAKARLQSLLTYHVFALEKVALEQLFLRIIPLSLPVMIPPLLCTHPSPPPDACDNPNQYHIHGLNFGGFISDLVLVTLLITELLDAHFTFS